MSVVSNDDMQDAAAAAVKSDEPPAQPPAPVEEPVQVPTLSEHVPHAELRYGRAQVEVRGYELAIAGLEMELRGAETKANGDITRIESDAASEIAEIEGSRNRRVARIKEDFIADTTNIKRRLEDLKEARDMLQAMVDVHAIRHPKPEETPDAETDPQSDPQRTGEAAGGGGQPPEQGAGGGAAG
jgi:hypothetical protein